MDLLDSITLEFTKGGSPGFVTLDDLVEAHLKCTDIEFATNPICDWNIVSRIARGHLINDPHLMLAKGKRRMLTYRAPGNSASFDWYSGGAFKTLCQQPLPFCRYLRLLIHWN